MDVTKVIEKIKITTSPLKRQLLAVALISSLLEKKGKEPPVVIGGCALSYYSREVYFTADIDLAYADRKALDKVLREIGFKREGRYWVNEGLEMAVEVPATTLSGEDSLMEIVEFDRGLICRIIGVEDLILDRLNACKHWKSTIDCEMVELLLQRYLDELDWSYLEKKASIPENETLDMLMDMRPRVKR
ncbi:MAG: hypothetical protein HY878_04380 [Deltaproteobacteria bacterium]|nr:hypothetical protein [Deltaproteobacteria bacterium]